MRILFVAMSNSIHTARWINQLSNQGWNIHLFPSYDVGTIHKALTNVVVHNGERGRPIVPARLELLRTKIMANAIQKHRAKQLAMVIDTLKPDIVHSLEFQGAGYLTYEAKKYVKERFPTWIVTNWGSDIYYFAQFPQHEKKIKALLSECNYYSCECQRDVALARQHGFNGEVLPVLPNTGGLDLKLIQALRQKTKTSNKKLIMLKGYQGWAGRANIGLQALQLCRDHLEGYEIVIYSSQLQSRIAARVFHRATRIPVRFVPQGTEHSEILKFHGQARISIGLSISDAISTSVLEAMAMGSLPVQSCTSCADEWIQDGKTGLLVPAEDPEAIAKAIRRALSDDVLVDQAARLNAKTIKGRLDEKIIKPQVVKLYQSIGQAS